MKWGKTSATTAMAMNSNSNECLKQARRTSVESLRVLASSGGLSKRQAEVLECLRRLGPSNARTLSAEIPGAWKRLTELRERGLVREAGEMVDKMTGRMTIIWEATPEHEPLPVPQRKRGQGVNAVLRARVRQLEEENKALRLRLSKWGRPTDRARALKAASPERQPMLGVE